MNRRLASSVISVGVLLALLLAWPRLNELVTIADVAMTATSQPRQEVLVSGYIKNRGAQAFSLETLLIEEPGKEPYHRRVSLDADSAFVLTLGAPKAGIYRVSVQIRSQTKETDPPRWAKSPALVVGSPSLTGPHIVRAKAYDIPRLSVIAAITVSIGGLALLISFWPRGTTR